MSWNYRIMRRVYDKPGILRPKHTEYGLHEVYYDADDKPHMHSEESMRVYGESLSEVAWMHEAIASALAKPVLDYETREPVPQGVIDADNAIMEDE